jgi:hypothetical protein
VAGSDFGMVRQRILEGLGFFGKSMASINGFDNRLDGKPASGKIMKVFFDSDNQERSYRF